MPRKKKEYRINVKVDKELYEFFKSYCEENRDTMSGYIKRHILDLKRKYEATTPYRTEVEKAVQPVQD